MKYAKLPLIPIVAARRRDEGMQDSTPIIEKLEAKFPDPSIHPAGSDGAAFVSALIEEFGDEWGNKWMFHYRWARPKWTKHSAGEANRAPRWRPPGADENAGRAGIAKRDQVDRMVNRVWFVGLEPADRAPDRRPPSRKAHRPPQSPPRRSSVPVRRAPRLR